MLIKNSVNEMNAINRNIYSIEKISSGNADIYMINENRQATMYLVCGNERACLIDSAYGLTDISKLVASLTELPVFVVNTHAHIDHVFGNRFFKKAYMHRAEMDLYQRIGGCFDEMLKLPWVKRNCGEYIMAGEMSPVQFPKADVIADGDVINLGGKELYVYEFPGHSPGSIILLDKDEKICFAGDSVTERPWLFTAENETIIEKVKTYQNNLYRAVDIMVDNGIERIFSGHYSGKPLRIADTDIMTSSLCDIMIGKAEGYKFTNEIGRGIGYNFATWSIMCCTYTELPH